MIDIEAWMIQYELAWRTDEPGDVAALFTEDAEYYRAPYRQAIVGRDAIVDWWIAEDESSDPGFTWQPVSVSETVAVVEGRTDYPGDTVYRNLWVIEFGEANRASKFTEWWMVEPQ